MLQAVYVSSSNIDAVGYQRGSMYIRFLHGGCYSYDHVPHAIYTNMIEAESAGQYFHKNVRSKFPYKKLDYDPFQLQEAA